MYLSPQPLFPDLPHRIHFLGCFWKKKPEESVWICFIQCVEQPKKIMIVNQGWKSKFFNGCSGAFWSVEAAVGEYLIFQCLCNEFLPFFTVWFLNVSVVCLFSTWHQLCRGSYKIFLVLLQLSRMEFFFFVKLWIGFRSVAAVVLQSQPTSKELSLQVYKSLMMLDACYLSQLLKELFDMVENGFN